MAEGGVSAGEQEQYVRSGSEFEFQFYCELCSDDGLNSEANGYCQDCCEYMCNACIDAHSKYRRTRNHEVLDQVSMPKDTPLSQDRVSKYVSLKCPSHKNETVKFYCLTHKALGCSTCFAIVHKKCADIESVYEKADTILDSKEFNEFESGVKDIRQSSRDKIYKTRESVAKSNQSCDATLKHIRHFKEELSATFEELEQNLVTQVETMSLADKSDMERLDRELTDIDAAADKLGGEIEALVNSKRLCQLYVYMRKMQAEVSSLKDKMKTAEEGAEIRSFIFQPNNAIRDAITASGLGKIVHDSNQHPKIVTNIATTLTTAHTGNDDGIAPTTSATTDAGKMIDIPISACISNKVDTGETIHTKESDNEINKTNNVKNENTTTRKGHDKSNTKTSEPHSSKPDCTKTLVGNSDNVATLRTQTTTATTADDRGKRGKITKASKSMTNNSNTSACHVFDIDVSLKKNHFKCNIMGSAMLSDTKLIAVDRNNWRVMLVDIGTTRIQSELKISDRPFDVAVINDKRLAITTWRDKFQIVLIDVADTLSLDRAISVSSDCRGVAFWQDKLLVTFFTGMLQYALFGKYPRLEIMDFQGKVTKTLERKKDGSKLFVAPRHVCVCKGGKSVYVSDVILKRVVHVTLEGEVISVYNDCKDPHKVCLDHCGNVYIADGSSRTVHMVTADCKKIKLLLKQEDGLNKPVTSLSHCKTTNRLYIGMEECDVIKVYELSCK